MPKSGKGVVSEEERRRRKLQSENDKKMAKRNLATAKKQFTAKDKVQVQKVKVMVKESGGDEAQQQLAAAIALPAHHMRRVPDMTAPSTALMRSTTSYGYRSTCYTEVCVDTPLIGSGAFVLFGQPGLSHARWQALSNSTNQRRSGYDMMFDVAGYTSGPSTDWTVYPTTNSTINSDVQDARDTDFEITLCASRVVAPMCAMSSFSNGSGYLSSAYPQSTFYDFHGPYMPLGVEDNSTWFFMNKGDIVLVKWELTATTTAVGSGITYAQNVNYGFQFWDGTDNPSVFEDKTESPSHTATTNSTFTNGSTPNYLIAKKPGFYQLVFNGASLKFLDTTATTAGVSVGSLVFKVRLFMNYRNANVSGPELTALWGGDANSWTTFPSSAQAANLPEYNGWALASSSMFRSEKDGDPTIGRNVRTSGVSLLITNITPASVQGGNFITARMKNAPFWDMTVASMSQSAGYSATMLEANGLYTFLLPEAGRLEFFDTVPYLKSTVFSTRFMIKPLIKDFYHMVIVPPTLSPYSAGVADNDIRVVTFSEAFQITVDEVFEFETTSRRYKTFPSPDPPGLLHAACVHFKGPKDWFYENPSHAAAIYAWLKAFKGKVKQYYPVVQAVGSAIDPRIGAALAMGRGLVYS